MVHTASGGVPRLINTVCDNALFEGSLARISVIGADLMRSVAKNLSLPTDEPITAADYLDPMFPQSQLPTLLPSAPVTPLPGMPAAATAALDEIDRVLLALSKAN
jgi:hypothetical protein